MRNLRAISTRGHLFGALAISTLGMLQPDEGIEILQGTASRYAERDYLPLWVKLAPAVSSTAAMDVAAEMFDRMISSEHKADVEAVRPPSRHSSTKPRRH